MSTAAHIVNVKVTRRELAIPELRDMFGLDRLPLAESEVSIEIKGVSTAVVNGLRRVVTDEMLGRALTIPEGGFNTELTTEVFMLPAFVRQRIMLLPLRPQIPPQVVAALRLKLDVTNRGATPLSVYSGDMLVTEGNMPEPLFNPTFRLATLQPGKRIVINDIHIEIGYGRDNGAFIVAKRATYHHLDIPEYTAEEVAAADVAAITGGAAKPTVADTVTTAATTATAVDLAANSDWCGYKVSSSIANPRHHRLIAILPATSATASESRAVFADACANIKDRLRLIERGVVDKDTAATRAVQYTVVMLEGGMSEGILQVPGETHTIGQILCRAVFDLEPRVSNVSHIIVSHEKKLVLTMRHVGDVTALLRAAIKTSIETFDVLQKGINSAS